MKTVHYLTGLPRSGNTLLSSLLNQNPNIYSSPLSPLPHVVNAIRKELLNSQDFLRNPNFIRAHSLIKNTFNNYYSDVDKQIVFDRSKYCFAPNMIETLTEIVNPEPKIVFTLRPVLEILASYLTLEKEHPTFIHKMLEESFFQYSYQTEDEAICDYIMHEVLPQSLYQVSRALEPQYRPFVHFVHYRDLVLNPVETMKSIYDFIGVQPFDHDFFRIQKIEIDLDADLGSHPNLHLVKPTIEYSSVDYRKILPESTQHRYAGLDFWEGQLDV